jgi:hypothetical protein
MLRDSLTQIKYCKSRIHKLVQLLIVETNFLHCLLLKLLFLNTGFYGRNWLDFFILRYKLDKKSYIDYCFLLIKFLGINTRAFRTSESESASESADFSEVRGLGLWKHFGLGLGLSVFVCLFTHLYCKEVNISQKKSEISKKKFNPIISFISHMHRYLL